MLQILLATFNGERWLPDQLASIAQQSRSDWQLLASDDGSSDGTLPLLRAAADADSRIALMSPNTGPPKGAAGNFARLLENLRLPAKTPVFLADQDDSWHPAKLERLDEHLQNSLLVFSDARIVDADGACTGTLFEALGVGVNVTLSGSLAENPAAGCTMAFRAELLDLALPVPKTVVNHDWWLMICAASMDSVTVCRETLVDYRQHAANAVGASRGILRLLKLPRLLTRQRRVLAGKPLALRELAKRLEIAGHTVPEDLVSYLATFDGRPLQRQALHILRGHYAPRSWSLRLLQVLALILPLGKPGLP